ncbi:MAG: glycoside hydrolase family 2 [Oscillospiraceae bacterium]|nr:glycoside hydrolase family 2 [Oscillospiraceae bacterium]
MSKIRTCQLTTEFENSKLTWEEYPRPQMRRDSYISLCGEWELFCRKGDFGALDGSEEKLGNIVVPYPPESRISGIERQIGKDEKYIYRRKFILPDDFNKGIILLHFGAVDQISRVRINGKYLGVNIGGYLPFEFDITDAVAEDENIIEVELMDRLDKDLPYGKQCEKRGGMWYTPISGIWQAVWLESVPENYIKSLRITPSLDSVTVEVVSAAEKFEIAVHTFNGDLVKQFSGNKVTVEIPDGVLWSPENPHLYEFTVTSENDRVESYFGLRTVTVESRGEKKYICLNGKPYFFHGLLDQGYFSDGIYTPATSEGYLFDITETKKLGFNMLRKHIKVEPDLFYYYCDKLGMIVFQDMVNSGGYNFLIDTALPTIGLRKGIKHKASRQQKVMFEKCAKGTVDVLYNHPCVCYYTIFNEGWGQFDADGMYRVLKQYDPTRIWDATSGWFTEKESDVQSEHIYFKPVKLKATDRPLVLSEFGGYSFKVEGHSFNLDRNYGYKTFDSAEKLTEGLEKLYLDEIVPAVENGLCAAVLTQVSDVEDETNGLFTYDRRVTKVDEKIMVSVAEKLKEVFDKVADNVL